MANPTPHYGWRLPFPGDTPWFSRVTSLQGGIDSAIASIVAGPWMRVTCVLSHYVNTIPGLGIRGDSYQTFSHAAWGGPSSGGLTVVGSPAQVTLRLELQYRRPSGTQNLLTPFAWRTVFRRPDGSEEWTPMGTSHWIHWMPGQLVDRKDLVWIGSVGAGPWRVELQANPGFLAVGDNLIAFPGDRAVLWAEETR